MIELDSNILCQITILDLSNKGLDEIPNNLVSYKNIRRFDCKNNYLKQLPELPKRLKYINVSNNILEELPDIPKGGCIFRRKK